MILAHGKSPRSNYVGGSGTVARFGTIPRTKGFARFSGVNHHCAIVYFCSLIMTDLLKLSAILIRSS